MDTPLVSVITPVYNGEVWLEETIRSVLAQTEKDWEMILVDDGSTDDTPAIAAEYDVKLISTENRGLSNARNTGYQAARGEIVAYIDDDELVEVTPNAVRLRKRFLDPHERKRQARAAG